MYLFYKTSFLNCSFTRMVGCVYNLPYDKEKTRMQVIHALICLRQKRKDDNVLQGESIYHCLYLSNSWTTNQNMLMFSKVFRKVSLNKSSGADPGQSAPGGSGSALFVICFAFVMYNDKKSFFFLSKQNMSISSKEPLSQPESIFWIHLAKLF